VPLRLLTLRFRRCFDRHLLHGFLLLEDVVELGLAQVSSGDEKLDRLAITDKKMTKDNSLTWHIHVKDNGY
jgi:hypothetical protein